MTHHAGLTLTEMAQKRTTFSPEQEKILRDFQDDGLIGTGAKFHSKIQLAVEATGLPRSVVCAKILNMKRTNTHKKRDPNIPLGSSGHNGYHLFCSKIGKVDDDAPTRQRKWGQLWRELPSQETDDYNKEAARCRKRPASEFTEEEKKKTVKKHSKNIKDSFAVLHELDVNGLCVLNKGNLTFTCSSGTGRKVLETHIDKIEVDLLTSSAKKQTVEKERLELKAELRRKIKDLYTTYKGRVSTFPYGKYKNNEADFVLHGLPQGTDLKDISTLSIEVLRTAVQAELVIMRKDNSCTVDENSSRNNTSSPTSATSLREVDDETTPCIIGVDGSVLGQIQVVSSSEQEENNEVERAGGIVPAETAMERLEALVAAKRKTTIKQKKEQKKTTLSPKITTYFTGSLSPSSD